MQPQKKKSNFWIKFFWILGLALICILVAIWITGYTYIYKTLIYTYPDIDDINIFDTRIVNDSIPQAWPVSSKYNKTDLPEEVDSALVHYETVAFLVIKNDSVVFERYWDRYLDNSFSNSFSMAKSIVGILTGIALDEGLFTLQDSVGKYIPEFSTGANGSLKIKHLLSMSSGLDWDESYSDLFSKTTKAYYGTNLRKQVTQLKVVEEPGRIFRYMSCNTVILSLLIEKTSGMNISDYASQKLWKRINATQPAYWSLDHFEGLEKSYCCFYSTARDFARIGKLYLDSGRWNYKQIVSKEFVQMSTLPAGCVDEKGKPVDYYGLHWWLMKTENHSLYYARGIYGQYIIVIPDERIIIVRLGKKRGEKTEGNHYTDMIEYTKGVLKAYGTTP
jgi:CubicO group peptidase (beta-lactamase class C family)